MLPKSVEGYLEMELEPDKQSLEALRALALGLNTNTTVFMASIYVAINGLKGLKVLESMAERGEWCFLASSKPNQYSAKHLRDINLKQKEIEKLKGHLEVSIQN